MLKLENSHNLERLKTDKIFLIQQKMANLEGVDYNIMPTIMNYKERILNEEEAEAYEATVEFKKDTLDPGRPIVGWE